MEGRKLLPACTEIEKAIESIRNRFKLNDKYTEKFKAYQKHRRETTEGETEDHLKRGAQLRITDKTIKIKNYLKEHNGLI